MYKFVEIDGADEFEFGAVVKAFNKKGEERLHVNYKKHYADKLVVTLEGVADSDELRAVKSITYAQFKRRYPQHRVYLQGYVQVGDE